ncbi:MAG TPA: DUF4893 domain-containing protein [Sphingomicrobium sp.]|nr:DUF4893 domain-containing protein [Sphingomicrobium sp.]
MNTRKFMAALAVLAAAGGCDLIEKRPQTAATVTVEAPTKAEAWKAVATPSDQDRINRLGLAWQQSMIEARPKFAREIDAEGDLLKALAALPRPQPTPGSYNCRMISVGKSDRKEASFEKFKPFFCYVLSDDDGTLTIVKQTGSQRPAGRLWDDDDPKRMIFLGSLALGDEQEPLGYGEDPDRDMAGVFERIAPFRWRLVIPWPRSGHKLEVFELTPVAIGQQPEG